jgi:hypothetical protein
MKVEEKIKSKKRGTETHYLLQCCDTDCTNVQNIQWMWHTDYFSLTKFSHWSRVPPFACRWPSHETLIPPTAKVKHLAKSSLVSVSFCQQQETRDLSPAPRISTQEQLRNHTRHTQLRARRRLYLATTTRITRTPSYSINCYRISTCKECIKAYTVTTVRWQHFALWLLTATMLNHNCIALIRYQHFKRP